MSAIVIHVHEEAETVIGKFEGINEIRTHSSVEFLVYDLIFEYCPICSDRLKWCRNSDLVFESYLDKETGKETTRVSLRGTYAEGIGETLQDAFLDLIQRNPLESGIRIKIHTSCDDHEYSIQ